LQIENRRSICNLQLSFVNWQCILMESTPSENPKKMPPAKCIGILTSGGDCPGLNAAIRGVAKPAISDFHIEVIGIEKGFRGLVENHSRVLHLHDISGILSLGGTILGTSREKPHKMPLPSGEAVDLTSRAVETYNRLGL